MALERVFCGVAAAEVHPWLTVAVVDDSGRLLDLRHVSDDPGGFGQLSTLLADRASSPAPVALDRGDRLIAQLFAASHRPVAIADDNLANDFADRFNGDTGYDEMRAPLDQRRAIGLARAVQGGAIYASTQHPTWNMDELKPMLAAHTAVTASRQASASALRDILHELYPAALRAYADPADAVVLRVLEALPEPGLLNASPSSRQREFGLIAEIAATGVADANGVAAAITALRVAVDDSPRLGLRPLGPVVAETVRQAVAAVRACDAAAASLVASMAERLGGSMPGPPAYGYDAAPVSPAPRRLNGPAAEVPPSRFAPRPNTASAAAAGLSAVTTGLAAPAAALAPQIPAPRPAPGFPAPGSRGDWPLAPVLDDYAIVPAAAPAPAQYQFDDAMVTTLSFSTDPLTAPLQTPPAGRYQPAAPPPAPPSPPSQPHSPAQPYPAQYSPAQGYPPHPQAQPYGQAPPAAYAPPAVPGWDPSPMRSGPTGDPLTGALPGVAGPSLSNGHGPADNDLLIFSDLPEPSAWFTQVEELKQADEPPAWGRRSDHGWRAAEQLSHPSVGDDTGAGLPRRVPQANLVPGSAQAPPRTLRIVRDASSIAAHTEGYFRGWRRGQEIGGFAIGQRDRAAWEFNRDQQRARLS